MNPVNGFTPEGLPTLILRDIAGPEHQCGFRGETRSKYSAGESTNPAYSSKTQQKEFNYPQGASNSLTSYEGTGGIVLGGFLRRIMIALDRERFGQAPLQRRRDL